jgi:hypothetical protein
VSGRVACRACHVRSVRKVPEANRHARRRGSAARADRVLLAFRAPGEAAVRGTVRCRIRARDHRHDDTDLLRPRGHARDQLQTGDAVHRARHLAARDGAGASGRAPCHADDAEPARQSGDRRQCVEPHSLAEPLARGAAVLVVLPERFRRPHRDTRHANRAGDPRDDRLAHHRRLVHSGLRHQRTSPAGACGPMARAADHALVRRLCDDPARAGAAHARPLEGNVRDALDAHGPHRPQ